MVAIVYEIFCIVLTPLQALPIAGLPFDLERRVFEHCSYPSGSQMSSYHDVFATRSAVSSGHADRLGSAMYVAAWYACITCHIFNAGPVKATADTTRARHLN